MSRFGYPRGRTRHPILADCIAHYLFGPEVASFHQKPPEEWVTGKECLNPLLA
jgi:hypothetical protein